MLNLKFHIVFLMYIHSFSLVMIPNTRYRHWLYFKCKVLKTYIKKFSTCDKIAPFQADHHIDCHGIWISMIFTFANTSGNVEVLWSQVTFTCFGVFKGSGLSLIIVVEAIECTWLQLNLLYMHISPYVCIIQGCAVNQIMIFQDLYLSDNMIHIWYKRRMALVHH